MSVTAASVPGPLDAEGVRQLLCSLGDDLRDLVVAARAALVPGDESLRAVTGSTAADTIYGIDRVTDDALLDWFRRRWPANEPVEVVSEGLDHPVVVGSDGAGAEATPRWTCIVDTIDGTRGLMYDKRAAWVLAAAAPWAAGVGGVGGVGEGAARRPSLRDLVVAAMTEVPTTKQWASDQISGVVGCGPTGLVAERHDVRTGDRLPLVVRPSQATALEHGFSSFARFFPQGKALVAGFEEDLWRTLHGDAAFERLAVFDDQYLATGGQLHELLAGHDRVVGDLRPLAFRELGLPDAIACHPYDCCTALLLEEAGGVVRSPWGDPLDAPLDTTTAVAWVGFANPTLAELVLPAMRALLPRWFPRSSG